jgi:hypothetical protein
MTTAADRMSFGEVLEAVDRLTSEEQEDLAAILQRRLAERGESGWLKTFERHAESSTRRLADRRQRTS